MELRRKRFDQSAEVRETELTRVELVELGELAVGRVAFQPGWRWSEHIKPIAETDYCQVHHIGYVVSGHLHVEMHDGVSVELVAGDVYEVPPGHDAWVVGDEPWVSVDYAGRRLFAKAAHDYTNRVLRTVVFTDLSKSTETLSRLGDMRWRLLLASTTNAPERRSSATRAARWTPPETAFSSSSTALRRRCEGLPRCATPLRASTSRRAPASTPARSSCRATRCAASPCTSRRASSGWLARVRCW